MHQRLRPLANAVGATLLLASLGPAAIYAETGRNDLRHTGAEPAVWQGPALTAQLVPPAGRDPVVPRPVPPTVPPQTIPAPAEIVTPSSTPNQYESPLLDGKLPAEELLPPVVAEGGSAETIEHRHVEPYGGGHPTDWSWGCGGSPYRTGPGMCDNWKVGCRWHVTVDGIVMTREDVDLNSMAERINSYIDPTTGLPVTIDPDPNAVNLGLDPILTQFDHGPGGRITFTSQIGRCSGYDVQAVYEGINDWEASVIYPKQGLPNIRGTIPILPSPNTFPPTPFPEGFVQRSLHYTSSMNSGELNFLPRNDTNWRPFFGVRYIRFDDKITDFENESRQVPLAGPRTDFIGPAVPPTVVVNDPIGPTFKTDRLNLFHLDNNLMGFQVGLLKDTLQLNERFAIEGFASAGVFYNRVKYSNVMGIFTTQTFADNTRTTAFDESRTDTSDIVNNDTRIISDVSYEAEASLTGVCRLNKCWALRGGYQVLWLNHIRTADAAFLGTGEGSQDLLFHGWHAGIECRR